eukprot:CAMPEP_0201681822 /NCGR_PEP_ID=MMETSP0494-20130426/51307_1 /ASSEMBLY_ACC=CAM_ASM_000839 /TAXON_ID=420259 /ORGANISM="Thalassiosira gravida, Strain GMp14c1" /LENGTH=904 /DNA_ID=CAMNT_0048165575 /DNA_START=19 /DNA_END=2733 /DNA_ORIENTATION=-
MAELVGRTISATSGGSGRPLSQHGGSRTRPAPSNTRAGGTNISSDLLGHDVIRLYSLVETAMMNMPAPKNDNAELRPTEVATMRDMANQTWESIREWLMAHPNMADRQAAAMHQGQFLTTALHMVCKLMDPPVDVVLSLIECAEDTVTWPDSNGWLPLHHACANSASGKVLSVLVQAYPEGKVQQDKRLRTPLHFTFFRKDYINDPSLKKHILNSEGKIVDDDDDVGNSMPEIVTLLADSGAAELEDEGGMLPLHYASAYGTTGEVLEVLLENYPESITKRENKGRNALHLAMVNAHRKSSPMVVGFLLEKNAAEIKDSYDDDHHLPIHLLAMASKFPPEKVLERENAADCLKTYLNAKPKSTADFLTAIQTLPEWLRDFAVLSDHVQDILNHKIVMRFPLPEWLRDFAVLSDHVQDILNHKIVMRFPTMILILDAFFLVLVIVMFEIASGDTIDHLFTRDNDDPDVKQEPVAKWGHIMMIFVSGAYFLLRETVQIISLLALGNLGSWLVDMANWLDVMLIFFIFYYGGIMVTNEPLVSNEAFRNGCAITKGIMWGAVIGFLKSTKVEFSVFVSGVSYVVQQLAAFLLALMIILLAFTQMFYILYSETEHCQCNKDHPDADQFPHCRFWDSSLKVYTMLMGVIGNDMRYSTVPLAHVLYFLFSFIVIILLGNVLIAIVTDSYGVIKNERSEMVFWSNRLDFVAEMDAIKNIGKSIMKCFPSKDSEESRPLHAEDANGNPIPIEEGRQTVGLFRNGWDSIMNLFNPDLYETYDVNPSSFEFWCYVLVRFAAAVIVIPVWLVVGLFTAGWLWPPQVREFLLKQKKVAVSRADLSEQVAERIDGVKVEIKKLHVDLKVEMKTDRREVDQVKAEVEAVQAEVMADLLQVKEIMVTLLEMSRDHLGNAS